MFIHRLKADIIVYHCIGLHRNIHKNTSMQKMCNVQQHIPYDRILCSRGRFRLQSRVFVS